MEPRTKQNLMVTVIGVSLFVALMNLGTVLSYLGKVVSIVMPVIVGGILALFIHVPMKGIENRLLKLFERKKKCPSATAIIPNVKDTAKYPSAMGIPSLRPFLKLSPFIFPAFFKASLESSIFHFTLLIYRI